MCILHAERNRIEMIVLTTQEYLHTRMRAQRQRRRGYTTAPYSRAGFMHLDPLLGMVMRHFSLALHSCLYLSRTRPCSMQPPQPCCALHPTVTSLIYDAVVATSKTLRNRKRRFARQPCRSRRNTAPQSEPTNASLPKATRAILRVLSTLVLLTQQKSMLLVCSPKVNILALNKMHREMPWMSTHVVRSQHTCVVSIEV